MTEVVNGSKNKENIKEQSKEVPHQWQHPQFPHQGLKKERKKKKNKKIHNGEYLLSFSQSRIDMLSNINN